MTGSFLDACPGFLRWAESADVFRNRNAIFVVDINSRGVRIDPTGLVSIHPDESGSTAWFADVLAGGSGPVLVAVPA